jgi:hypothetical protein
MLTTGPFLALALFFFALFDRVFTEARPALRAISRRRFALQNRINLSSILLDQLAHSCVYRLLSGGYTLFQIQRVGLKLRGLEQLTPVTCGAPR